MLYISSGMEKSGSTYTYYVAKLTLEAAGYPYIRLSMEDQRDERAWDWGVNTINDWTPEIVKELAARNPQDGILLLRTHRAPTAAIAALMKETGGKVHTAIRDPRDVALSLTDVVARQIRHGRPNRLGIDPLDATTTFRAIGRSLDRATAWIDGFDSIPLYYENTAFQPEISIRAICDQLGLPALDNLAAQLATAAAANPSTKRNVAQPLRHTREMTAKVQEAFLAQFHRFYDRFFPEACVVVAN